MPDLFVRSSGGALLPSGPYDAEDMAALPRDRILRVGVNLATHTDLQRRIMWGSITDVMKAAREGRRWGKDTWKRAYREINEFEEQLAKKRFQPRFVITENPHISMALAASKCERINPRASYIRRFRSRRRCARPRP